jgi:hypothetical protein
MTGAPKSIDPTVLAQLGLRISSRAKD